MENNALSLASGAVKLERHPTLYITEGDIVLSAPLSATSVQLFRVKRGPLCTNSPVFHDTLSLPVGEGSEVETYDGVPIINLHDDAKDLAGLLNAI